MQSATSNSTQELRQPANFKHYLLLHFIIFVYGFSALAGVSMKIDTLAVATYRTLIATLGLLLLNYYYGVKVGCDKKIIPKLLGVGALLGFHWILFFGSARVSNVSVCLAGLATCPVWTSILEPIINKKRINPIEVLLSFVVFLGLYLIFLFSFDHFVGLLMGVGSALLASLFSIANSKLTFNFPATLISFYEMLGAFIVSLISAVIAYSFFNLEAVSLMPNLKDLLWLLFLALGCSVFGFTFSIKLLKNFSAFASNLAINLEPVYGIIIAYLLLGETEHMHLGFYIGTALIVLSVLIHPFACRIYQK